MANTHQIVDDLKQSLGKARPPFLQCIGARLSLQQDGDSPSPIITIFAEADSQLTKQMLRSAEYTYPLAMLMNNWLTYTWVVDYIQKHKLVFDTSELMTAAVVGVAEGMNFGPHVDATTKTLHVPAMQLPLPNLKVKKRLSAIESWTAMLLAPDLPGIRTYNEDDRRPVLRVVHVPFSPSLKDEQTRTRVARLTVGWNYCRMSSEPEAFTEMLGGSIADHFQQATSAAVYLQE